MNFNRRKVSAIILIVAVLAFNSLPGIRALLSIPGSIRISQDQTITLDWPAIPYLRTADEEIIELKGEFLLDGDWTVLQKTPLMIRPLRTGKTTLEMSLFGLIPWKRVEVEVVPRIEVIPGGQSIGVLLRSRGVIVIKEAPVIGADERQYYPTRGSGLTAGDVILRVDGVEPESTAEVARLINQAGVEGRSVRLEYLENGEGNPRQTVVTPVYDVRSGTFRIGLYIKDGAAGVGTLTFYEPLTGRYAALGHGIVEGAGGRLVDVSRGSVVAAPVSEIQPGRRGAPGEKIAFFTGGEEIGTIEMNTPFGISGTIQELPENGHFPEPIPVAMREEIHKGPAEILTVVQGTRVERFNVEILEVYRQDEPGDKSMVIEVTDPDLLKATGGIVQGMSGSPIIQDGRLIGAVTHVWVNDPTKGYGILVEWMLDEMKLIQPINRQGSAGSRDVPALTAGFFVEMCPKLRVYFSSFAEGRK